MDFGISAATYLVLIFTILYFLKQWNKKSISNFPPGPKGLPLIGYLHVMNLENPHVTYLELAKKYGSVFSVPMGMKRTVVLAGYETVKDALVNHAEDFGERARIEIFKTMDKGMGLSFSHGDNWKVMRRFTIKTLRDYGMGKSTIEDKIVEECGHLIQYVSSFKGQRIDDPMILNAGVGNIIVSILFGQRMDYNDPTFRKLISLTDQNNKYLGSPMVSIYNIFPFLGFLPGTHKIVSSNTDKLVEYATQTFTERLKDLDENGQRGYIDAFLVKQKEDAENPKSYFHDDNLTRVVRNLLSAGTETTTNTLNWALLLMAKHKDIQEKVQDEIYRVVGHAQPLYSHRGQMPYTNAVVHEIQRYSDIVPISVAHETSRDVTFKGYFIPKGTCIVPLLSSVLRDKTQFERPDEFYPNHFLDAKGNFLKKDAFMPFSAGRRACAGETLARMELFMFFTTLLQKFTFRSPAGVSGVDMTPGMGYITTPKKLMICADARY
ncbi:cytochrome P450 2K6-like [Pseudophryne corroboree]|uniref:cytochrome P450 2K6-like n=1 Tax=Pseudophryne corroboree TaxID=495146 RepID=UPI0030821BCF